ENAIEEAALMRLQDELTQFRQSYTSLLQSFESIRLAESQSISNVIIVEPAQVPDAPVRPRTLLNTALAAVVGLMLAVGVVFLIEYLDDSIRSPDQVLAALGVPVVGVVARVDGMSEHLMPIAREQPRSPVAEAYRGLRTNIQFAGVDKPIKMLLVTSAGPAEGKTTTAANLAVVMAQAGLQVTLVDADLRRPGSHRMFGRPNRNGLTDLMLKSTNGMEGVLQETGVNNLNLVASGTIPPNPSELLGSQKMAAILQDFAEMCDMVIVDSPPALAVTDAVVLSRAVDGVLLVVDSGTTSIGAAAQSKAQLDQVGAQVLGVVLNRVTARRGGYYYEYYSGRYYSADGDRASNGKRRLRGRKPEPAAPASEAKLAQE
ncbi:MAG: polysaccharide biosynthesis tyrosine autokinase, partial [Anaerolineales bacterium]